jgi:hypothetical protein
METGYMLFQAAGWAADTSWQLARRACSRERGQGGGGGPDLEGHDGCDLQWRGEYSTRPGQPVREVGRHQMSQDVMQCWSGRVLRRDEGRSQLWLAVRGEGADPTDCSSCGPLKRVGEGRRLEEGESRVRCVLGHGGDSSGLKTRRQLGMSKHSDLMGLNRPWREL